MAPVETFYPSKVNLQSELMPAVANVMRAQHEGAMGTNSGEDEQTLEQYVIYTIGSSRDEATSVVLIGNDASESPRIEDIGKGVLHIN